VNCYLLVAVEIPPVSDTQQLDGKTASKIQLYRECVVGDWKCRAGKHQV